MAYSDLLKDPRWQKKRLAIFKRDKWTCQFCDDDTQTLAIHHLQYIFGKNPWEYKNEKLITACERCHTLLSNKEEIERSTNRLLNILNQNGFNDYQVHWICQILYMLGDVRDNRKFVFFKKFLKMSKRYFLKNGYINE